MTAAQGGDTAAFEMLYRRYVTPVYTLAFRMYASHEAAEDAVQVVFFRAWNKIGTYQGKSSFFTWLHRLAIHTIIRGRKRWVPSRHEDILETVPDSGTRDASELWDLRRAITGLPARALVHRVRKLIRRELER